ncbi:MAG TPA: HigA family addiction module antitoxin [Ktedonobacteraceae bacterium]|nr:HigA family addiction module antitoxin [Ktedonobacteraceae bacterium]
MRKRPLYPIHPGEIVADELVELHKSPTELARELHVPANRISQLVAGKRAMTADTALRLERWLGVSAAFWMNLQKRYELDIAREKSDDILKMIEPLHQTSGKPKAQQL